MRLFLAAIFVSAAAAAAGAAQMPGTGQAVPAPAKRTAFDDCMDKVKTPKDIERMELHLLRSEDRPRVASELAGVLVCQAMVERAADPCAKLKGLGKPLGSAKGVSSMSEDTFIARCRQDMLFARFYQEAMSSGKKTKKYPACFDYFGHIPIIAVGAGFERTCATMAGYIQNQVQDGFCDKRMDPYVKDKTQWGVLCKVVGEIYVSANAQNCSYFPDPTACAEQAAMVPAFQSRRPESCGGDMAGGICHGILPSPDSKVSRCKLPWLNLSRDYCQSMVKAGVFNKAGQDGKNAEEQPAEQDQQPSEGQQAAPSEER